MQFLFSSAYNTSNFKIKISNFLHIATNTESPYCMCPMSCALCYMSFALCPVFYVLFSVFCILCSMSHVLCFVFSYSTYYSFSTSSSFSTTISIVIYKRRDPSQIFNEVLWGGTMLSTYIQT